MYTDIQYVCLCMFGFTGVMLIIIMTLQLHHNICTDLLNLCHDRQIRDTFNCVECLVLIHRGPHG
jgi:hypothetical protein